MVKRDYSTRADPRKKGCKKPVNRSALPKNLLFFVAGILLTLTGALYWVKQQGIDPKRPADPKRLLQPALPPKPQERWRYIKALESKQIKVVSPAPIPPSIQGVTTSRPIEKTAPRPPFKAPQWLLQCDAFQPIEQAQALRANLALLGFEGSIFQEGKRYRVLLGPYPQRAIADRIFRQLKQAQISHCAVTAAYH